MCDEVRFTVYYFPTPLTTEELRVFLVISRLVFGHCRELRLLFPSKNRLKIVFKHFYIFYFRKMEGNMTIISIIYTPLRYIMGLEKPF